MVDRRTFLKYAASGAALTALSEAPSHAAEAGAAPRQPGAEVAEKGVAELSAAMTSGALNAEAIVAAYLERIEKIDRSGPAVNSVIEVNPDALAIARGLDAERAAAMLDYVDRMLGKP